MLELKQKMKLDVLMKKNVCEDWKLRLKQKGFKMSRTDLGEMKKIEEKKPYAFKN